MKIRHERPQSDLSFQVRAPLELHLASGEVVRIEEWALDGFHYPEPADVLPKEALLSIPFQGVDIRFRVRLLSEPGSRFLRFDGLSGRERETLAVFYRSILSGRMASTDEMITSLDTPVDLVPMGETEEEESAGRAKASSRSLRAVFSMALYICLAGVVFWTLGSGIYGKLASVTLQNARIEAPLVSHVAPDTAYVSRIEAVLGQDVKAGDILVRLSTPEGEAALADVRARIDLLERRYAEAQARLAEAEARILHARSVLAANPMTTQEDLAKFDQGMDPVSRSLFDAADAIRRELDALEDELRRLRRERGRLRGASDALHVIAAQDGTVTSLEVLRGQLVGRGTPVAEIEANTPRVARGWVDQSMSGALYPGVNVRVDITTSEGRQTRTAQVVEMVAGIDQELTPEFGMLVSVAFPDMTLEETRSRLPHLMPVSLKAERAWATAVRNRIRQLGLGD